MSDSDNTNSKDNQDYDIGADLGGASPTHVWMRELQFNSEGEDYEDIQDHEGQDKQNKQGREDFIQEELYPPSLLGPSQPYRILRDRAPPKLSLPKWASSTKPTKTIRTKNVGKRRAKWTDDDLVGAIACYDVGYKLGECCKAFNIPKSSLRDHLSGKTKSRKIRATTILTKEEEALIIQYMDEMLEIGQPLTPQMLKLKAAEVCQGRLTPFKDGIPGESWLYWFRQRHLHLVMRVPQGLPHARAKAMNPITCHGFYSNLLQLYNKFQYPHSHIWNVDESGCNASISGLAKVLARKDVRSVHAQIPNEREWLSVLTSINAAGSYIPHFFIFKGKRRLKDYIHLYRAGTTMAMQDKGYMTSYLFSRWMDHFIEHLHDLQLLSPSNRHLIILDGHKSHLTLEVIQKAKEHGVDMLSLPFHTSHALQPLDVACFKPFKTAFRAYRDKYMMDKHGGKVEKDTLAYWVDLALTKALSKSNIMAGFRATGIWPLNLERMQTKMEPSKPFYPIPSCKVIVSEIMDEDLQRDEDGALHYYVEDEGVMNGESLADPEIVTGISQFLKLPQKSVQATRILH